MQQRTNRLSVRSHNTEPLGGAIKGKTRAPLQPLQSNANTRFNRAVPVKQARAPLQVFMEEPSSKGMRGYSGVGISGCGLYTLCRAV